VTAPGQEREAIPESTAAEPLSGHDAHPGQADLKPAVEQVDTSWVKTELIFHEPPASWMDEISR